MKRLLPVLLLVFSVGVGANDAVYDAVVAGKECRSKENYPLHCTYRVGVDLEIIIAGVGDPDTLIVFKSSRYDGDYYGAVGVLHGCVIVRPGGPWVDHPVGSIAFISPINGKVYKTWDACHSRY